MKLTTISKRFDEYPEASRDNCRRLTQDEGMSLAELICSESHTKKLEPDPLMALSGMSLPSQVVGKRVKKLNLSIGFTTEALLAVGVLCRTPGEAVIFLADCLHKYENTLVTMTVLASSLYPNGFYREEIVAIIIDKFMKPGVHPWSAIY